MDSAFYFDAAALATISFANYYSILFWRYLHLTWGLETSTSSWSITVVHPTPLAAKNRMRVDPMLPSPTSRTEDDGSLRWPNTPNTSERRSWRGYREIWSIRSCSLLRNLHSSPPPFEIEVEDGSLGATPSSTPSTLLMKTSHLGSILGPS